MGYRGLPGCTFLICLCFVLFFPLVPSAQQYNFRQFTVRDGLAQSQVISLYQDNDGYLWAGTIGGGVSKFDGREFVNISTEDGLSDNRVFDVVEDKYGAVWIATDNGLNRYNGRLFTSFYREDGLMDNQITDLLMDKDGNLWVATENGLNLLVGINSAHRFEKENVVIKSYDTQDGLTGNHVNTLLEDNDGNIWVGTTKGVTKIIREPTQKISTKYTLPVLQITQKDGLASNEVSAMTLDKKGDLWLGTNNQGINILRISQTTGEPQEVPSILTIQKQHNLCDNRINTIYSDQSGYIWVTTQDGVNKIDPYKAKHRKYNFTTFVKESGLKTDIVYSVIEDREGNMWFGTNKGLNKYAGKAFLSYTKSQGLKSNLVFSIVGDHKNDIWIGTYEGITRFLSPGHQKKTERSSINYTIDEGLSHQRIRDIEEDRYGNIWVATRGGGLNKLVMNRNRNLHHSPYIIYYGVENGLATDQLLNLEFDQEGNLWIGTMGGGLSKLPAKHVKSGVASGNIIQTYGKGEKGLQSPIVYSIVEDTNNDCLWLGTFQGIAEFDGDTFTHYTQEDGLVSNEVMTLKKGQDSNLWIGTFGGLALYDGREFTNFTESDGMASNTVYLLTFDAFHNLWIGSQKGIDKFDLEKFQKGEVDFEHYGSAEGFMGIECNVNAVYRDKQENLWFGTVNGAIRYRPHRDQPNLIRTKTNITNVKIFLKDTVLHQHARLPYYKNYITFNYTGICFTNPDKVKYRYKLEGFTDWSPVTEKNSATYSNLPPGEYTFMVMSRNNEGLWNKQPTQFHFTITPPFWQETWFYIAVIMLGIGGIYGLIQWRERNYQRTKEHLEERVKVRTQQLEKQKEKLEEANQELEKLSLVASQTDNGIMICGPNGELEWMNDGFARITGYDSIEKYKEEKGRTLFEASANPEIKRIINQSIEEKTSKKYEAINITRDGEKRWVSSTLTPILDEDGNIRQLIVIDTDITDRKRAEEVIKKKNKDITSSIKYAKNIQEAILPDMEEVKQVFPRSFVYYNPLSIVSGDFYWFYQTVEYNFLVVADCTGHGVPGAFMSMIGNDLLNQTIIERDVHEPAAILTELNKGVIEQLQQRKEGTEAEDGMDLSLCRFHHSMEKVKFAGALRPLYIVRENELHEYKGDRYPIGGYYGGQKSFTDQEVKLQDGDTFYMFSDGYPDQFGGEKGKKFMTQRFKQLLTNIRDENMDRQREILEKTIDDWMEGEEQVDDMLVIGVRI